MNPNFHMEGIIVIDKNINAIEKIVMEDSEDGYQDYSEWLHECEIIGNIFDDPELLEAQSGLKAEKYAIR